MKKLTPNLFKLLTTVAFLILFENCNTPKTVSTAANSAATIEKKFEYERWQQRADFRPAWHSRAGCWRRHNA